MYAAMSKGSDLVSCIDGKKTKPIEVSQNCKAFLKHYVQISNSRLDLLYRFYNSKAELFVHEISCEMKQPDEVHANGQQEIRHLLVSLFDDVKHEVVHAVHEMFIKEHTLLFTRGTFRVKNSDVLYHFSRTLRIEQSTRGLAISSETLLLHPTNSRDSLLDQARSKLRFFHQNLALHFPQVLERTFRVTSGVRKVQTSSCIHSVRSLSRLLRTITPSVVEKITGLPLKSFCKNLLTSVEGQVRHFDAELVMEFCEDGVNSWSQATSRDERSSRIWNSSPTRALSNFPQSLSPLTLNYSYPLLPKKSPRLTECELRLDTPLEVALRHKVEDKTNDNLTSPFVEYTPPPPPLPTNEEHNQKLQDSNPLPEVGRRPFLSIFDPSPEPVGAPMVWDLSHDAVSTQMRIYHEMVDRLKMEVPDYTVTEESSSNVPWNERTVFLGNLPRDVHPDSLRRAFEVMFGQIEEENGIILCSARSLSIAYVVFKSKRSAEAVGRSDCWIKGSKLIIQKYKDVYEIQSMRHHEDALMYSRTNDQCHDCSSSSSRSSSTLSTATSGALSLN
eukprot:g6960.t1